MGDNSIQDARGKGDTNSHYTGEECSSKSAYWCIACAWNC